MAECPHLARTSAYFDGALDPADEGAAVDHLATCEECQALLGGAVSLDAAVSQAPPVVVPARKRRWPIVAAAAGALAIAATTVLIVRPGADKPLAVAIELPAERSIEARFSGGRFAPHRPLAVLRGDRASEAIPLATLAELERRGDTRDLVAALAATENLARARALADKLPHDPAGDTDRAALALAARDDEAALVHATHALDRDPAALPARWNYALAAHRLGLERVARAALAQVVAANERGWSEEARALLAKLDEALAPELGFAAFDARGRAMVDGGPPITLDDVRRYPAFARVYILDALRVNDPEPLAPLAQALGKEGEAALARARAVAPAVRAKFAASYRAVVARTATPAEITQLIAALAKANAPDLLAGTIITGSQWAQQTALLEATVAPWDDPWFDVFVARAKIRAQHGTTLGDLRGVPALEALHATCAPEASLRCGQVAQDIAQVLFDAGRPQDAEPWAARAIEHYRRAVAPAHIATARATLAALHRAVGRDALARAEFAEVIASRPACGVERWARILAADLALVAGQWASVRELLPPATPPAGCAGTEELQGILTATDLARRTGEATDLAAARAWIAAVRANPEPSGAGNNEGIARVATLRIGGDAGPVHAWLAEHPAVAGDPRRDDVRAWAVTTVISAAGARADWAAVIATAKLERPLGEAPCLVVASADDGTVTVAAQTPTQLVGAQRRVEPTEVATLAIVPPDTLAALASCTGIALAARGPLHGRSDLLAPELPWWFAGGAPPRTPASPPVAIEVTSPDTPDRDLPPLPAPGPSSSTFAQRLSGRDATPKRVLDALAAATYAELHVHGIVSARDDASAYLALAADPDGSFALRADMLRQATLAKAPLVVLAACRAGAVNPTLRTRWSLPDAFLAAGASGVVAVDIPIPDASARPIFDELHRRVEGGETVERALASIRGAAKEPWVRHLMLFR